MREGDSGISLHFTLNGDSASAMALISVEGVRLLNACEDDGVAIINASPYISKWMALERY